MSESELLFIMFLLPVAIGFWGLIIITLIDLWKDLNDD